MIKSENVPDYDLAFLVLEKKKKEKKLITGYGYEWDCVYISDSN